MRLHRLTGLEQEKLTEEYRQLLDTIAGLIASSRTRTCCWR